MIIYFIQQTMLQVTEDTITTADTTTMEAVGEDANKP